MKLLLENWRQFLKENRKPLFKKAKVKRYIDLGLFAEGETMPVGAVAVIFDSEGRVLIALRPKEDRWMPAKWALIGGKLNDGESPIQAVIREVEEETSLKIKNPTEFYTSKNGEVIYFFTRDYDGDVVLDFEHDDYAWVYPEKLTNYDVVPGLINVVNMAQKVLRMYA